MKAPIMFIAITPTHRSPIARPPGESLNQPRAAAGRRTPARARRWAPHVAGSGIGLAFPHLTVATLGAVADEEEGAKAAAGINTVLIIAGTFSAAAAGVIVNLGADLVTSAHYLMFGFAAVTVLGVLPARAAMRR